MLWISVGKAKTKTNRKRPWKKFAHPVRPQLFTLALLRTISAIIGRPPIMPEMELPAATALRSLFRSLCRFQGSNLSTALVLSNDSMPCTRVMLTTAIRNG